jgi:hypothetical protein
MTAGRITVRMSGDLGLDYANELLTELKKATGYDWSSEKRSGGDHLTAVEEIILSAVIGALGTKGTDLAFDAVVGRVREIVKRWKNGRLNPPDVIVEAAVETPDEEPQEN